MFSLMQMLGRNTPGIGVLDLGAMALEGEAPPWQKLLAAPATTVVGFEPVQAECDKLNASARKGHRFLPHFVGDGRERTFHLCNFPMTSSLYEPNTALLSRFQNLEELTRCVETSSVTTVRLDDIADLGPVDYIKMDIQGAELDAIRGGERTVGSALVVESEVEFVEMYKGQPLFADVDAALRGLGYVFHTFSGIAGRAFKPLVVNSDINRPLRQHLWANAVYVRDFMRWKDMEAASLLKIAVILHEVYQSVDLAALALQYYDVRTRAGLWPVYMSRLHPGGKTPSPVPLDV